MGFAVTIFLLTVFSGAYMTKFVDPYISVRRAAAANGATNVTVRAAIEALPTNLRQKFSDKANLNSIRKLLNGPLSLGGRAVRGSSRSRSGTQTKGAGLVSMGLGGIMILTGVGLGIDRSINGRERPTAEQKKRDIAMGIMLGLGVLFLALGGFRYSQGSPAAEAPVVVAAAEQPEAAAAAAAPNTGAPAGAPNTGAPAPNAGYRHHRHQEMLVERQRYKKIYKK
jgi:hypothetical protein